MAGHHDEEYLRMIDAAIDDELKAVGEYTGMARMADNPTMKAILMGIAGDEYGHARTFMVLRECLRGRDYMDSY